MKFTIAYYLLLLYVSVLLRPAFPLLSDVLCHTFTESVHLSTVHMVYGPNHLQRDIATNTDDNKQSAHGNNIVKGMELFAVHLLQNAYHLICPKVFSTLSFASLSIRSLLPGYTNCYVPPPDIVG